MQNSWIRITVRIHRFRKQLSITHNARWCVPHNSSWNQLYGTATSSCHKLDAGAVCIICHPRLDLHQSLEHLCLSVFKGIVRLDHRGILADHSSSYLQRIFLMTEGFPFFFLPPLLLVTFSCSNFSLRFFESSWRPTSQKVSIFGLFWNDSWVFVKND